MLNKKVIDMLYVHYLNIVVLLLNVTYLEQSNIQ